MTGIFLIAHVFRVTLDYIYITFRFISAKNQFEAYRLHGYDAVYSGISNRMQGKILKSRYTSAGPDDVISQRQGRENLKYDSNIVCGAFFVVII